MSTIKFSAMRWMLSLGAVAMVGCTSRPPFFPNADPSLRRSSDDFAADAAKRHYEASAPRAGDANGRAEVDYGIDRIYLANTSNTDWKNAELWVNKSYVVLLPRVPAKGSPALNISFASIYNSSGQHFPFNSTQSPIDCIELFLNGKMYNVTMALAD